MSTGVDLSQSVFDHWRSVMNHTGAKFDAKRRRAVQQALKLGYTEQQLKQAVDGCKASPYHQGQNKDSQVYDSLTLIVRDAEHIDRFIGIAVNGPPRGDVRKGPQRAEDQGWTANDKTGVVSVSQTQEAIGWK